MPVRRISRHFSMLLVPLALCCLLAGCGLKGDLYLPKKAHAELAPPHPAGPAETAPARRS